MLETHLDVYFFRQQNPPLAFPMCRQAKIPRTAYPSRLMGSNYKPVCSGCGLKGEPINVVMGEVWPCLCRTCKQITATDLQAVKRVCSKCGNEDISICPTTLNDGEYFSDYLINGEGKEPLLLVQDRAMKRIPKRLGNDAVIRYIDKQWDVIYQRYAQYCEAHPLRIECPQCNELGLRFEGC